MGLLNLVRDIPDKNSAVTFLQTRGLLHSRRICRNGHQMKLVITEKEDRWMCHLRGCRQTIRLRKDTSGSFVKLLSGWKDKKKEEVLDVDDRGRCLTYGDDTILLEGLPQAQLLTNTLLFDSHLLASNKDIPLQEQSPLQDKLIKRCIRSSLLYDATQEKLPRRHDPLREAWIFPRDYGITDKRRNYLLANRLLHLCSSYSPQLLGQRALINSPKFVVPFTSSSGQQILFSVTGDAVLMADTHPSCEPSSQLPEAQLPSIYPLEPTVSLEYINSPKFEASFPVKGSSTLSKVHTVFIHYNESQVSNVLEERQVRAEQILGRTLVHSWVIAMSQAATNISNGEVGVPVTIQAVQSDGQFFHFSIFQLRSTSVDSDATPNIFWSFPLMNIFESCSYVQGVPTLEGYNSNVFKTLLAFYNN